jgi:hypothetical protein
MSDYLNIFIKRCKPLIHTTFEDEMSDSELDKLHENQQIIYSYLPDIFEQRMIFIDENDYDTYVKKCYHIDRKNILEYKYVPTIIVLLKMAKIFPDDENINIIINKWCDNLKAEQIGNLSYDIVYIDQNENYERRLFDSFTVNLFENINSFSFEIVYKFLLKLFRCNEIPYLKEQLEMTHNKLLNKYPNKFYNNLRYLFFLTTLEQYFYFDKQDINNFIDLNNIENNQQSIFFDIYMAYVFINNIKNDNFIDVKIKDNDLISQFYKNILLLNKNNIKSIHKYFSTKTMDGFYKNKLYFLEIIFENNLIKSHNDDYNIQKSELINTETFMSSINFQPQSIDVQSGGNNKIFAYVYHKLYNWINGLLDN